MRTKLLVILIAISGTSFLVVAMDIFSSYAISYTLFQYLPMRIKNNPATHYFVISDIHNTVEYKAFASRFLIYDEGIISIGTGMEYMVTSKNNQTGNLLVLNFKYYPYTDKITTYIHCSVNDSNHTTQIYSNELPYENRTAKYIETTDCLKD